MAQEYKLSYTATEIDEKLRYVDNLMNSDEGGYATEQFVHDGFQPKGNYLTEVPEGYAKTDDIPKKPEDIGAQPVGDYALRSEIPSVPVKSVNGKTGAVSLSASDVGADAYGTASSAVSAHNTNTSSHADIRQSISQLSSEKVDATQLTTAVNNALSEAKNSGEFDGKDGVSPTITTAAITGGNRITITDKNGTKNVDIMNGSKGDTGKSISNVARTSGNGAAGTTDTYTITYSDGSTSTFNVYNGKNGTNGTSVTVQSVSESSSDGGNNVVTFSDGKTVTIKNGSKGTSPVKGTDYWTDADKQEIVSQVSTNTWVDIENNQIIGKLVYGNVGKNITITDNAAGRYTMVDVSEYAKIKASGYQWVASYGYHMVSFTDMAGKVLSVYTPADSTAAECELIVPDGAKFAYITGKNTIEISVSGYKFYNIAVLAEEKADKYATWINPNKTVAEAKLAYKSGSTVDHANGRCITVEVAGYQKVRCLGYQFAKSNFSVCMFYDKNGTLISAHQGEAENARAALELSVPTNAYTFKMNSHKNLAPLEYVELFKPMSIKELYDDLKPIGKKLITLGDSITALGTGSTGWVRYFMDKTGCTLVANTAVNGAVLSDYTGTTYDGNPSSSTQTNNVLGNQVQKIINNAYEAPDIIIIAIGTNGGISITKEQMSATYYNSDGALIPLDNVDRKTNAGAYRWCLEKLHETYPDAIIFWCTPIMGYQKTRSAENAMQYAESLRIATEYTGQIMIDTIRCGINGVNELASANGEYLVDGLHPNSNGARKIGYYNASKVKPFLVNNFIEV